MGGMHPGMGGGVQIDPEMLFNMFGQGGGGHPGMGGGGGGFGGAGGRRGQQGGFPSGFSF
jgi:DnaJ homolog subfamily C member 7